MFEKEVETERSISDVNKKIRFFFFFSTHSIGEQCTVENNKLLSLCGSKENEETEKGKDEAAVALANRLKVSRAKL